jgi:antitoxin Phd
LLVLATRGVSVPQLLLISFRVRLRRNLRAAAALVLGRERGVRRRRLYNTRVVLYALCMTTMTVSAARQNLPGAVDQAQTEPVVLERYGRAAAVLVSPEHYARLVAALEDAEDVEAFDAAMAEEGANIPWDQAKADLGWE